MSIGLICLIGLLPKVVFAQVSLVQQIDRTRTLFVQSDAGDSWLAVIHPPSLVPAVTSLHVGDKSVVGPINRVSFAQRVSGIVLNGAVQGRGLDPIVPTAGSREALEFVFEGHPVLPDEDGHLEVVTAIDSCISVTAVSVFVYDADGR